MTPTSKSAAVALLVAITLSACDFRYSSETAGHGVGFEEPATAEALSRALTAEQIPHEVSARDGLSVVTWTVEHDADANRILRVVEGRPPEDTRSLCFGSEDRQARLAASLDRHGVPHVARPRHPDGWCVHWSKDVDDAVAAADANYRQIRELERSRGARQ